MFKAHFLKAFKQQTGISPMMEVQKFTRLQLLNRFQRHLQWLRRWIITHIQEIAVAQTCSI
jgi:hypothetical protein